MLNDNNNIFQVKDKYIDFNLYKEIKINLINGVPKNYIFKTKSRSSMVYPCFINLTFGVYNGKKYHILKIHKNFVGNKLGEFSFTRRLGNHKKKAKPTAIKKKIKQLSLYRRYFDNCKYKPNLLTRKELFLENTNAI